MSLLATTIVHTLVIPTREAHAAAALIAPLHTSIMVSEDGRVLRTDGIRLATIAGNALMSTASPVTLLSQIKPKPIAPPLASRLPFALVVPTGTTFRVVVTGYSSTPDQTDASPFITASGTHVHDGTVAVNFLPFGTRVTFPDHAGEKTYSVEDRTAQRFSDRADIWFPSREEALQFGKRTLTMVVTR